MSLISVGSAIWHPGTWFNGHLGFSGSAGGIIGAQVLTLDAATEKNALIGYVHWEGRPTAAKAVGTTAKISFRTNSVTFADASTTLRIGIQDVATATVTQIVPDEVWTDEPYVDLVGNGGVLTSSDDDVWKTVTLGSGGSRNITHGDLIAIVFDMTARGGSDSVRINGLPCVNNGYSVIPVCLSYSGGWAQGAATVQTPNVMITADDGTRGILAGGVAFSNYGGTAFQDSTNPDERGLIFQVPFRCKMNQFVASISANSADANGTFRLYSTPLGTPAEVWSLAFDGSYGNASGEERMAVFVLPGEHTLEANTDYCLALRATGAAAITLGEVFVGDANDRTVQGLANCRLGTRDGGSGAFSETTTTIPLMGIGISQIDNGEGGPNVGDRTGGLR